MAKDNPPPINVQLPGGAASGPYGLGKTGQLTVPGAVAALGMPRQKNGLTVDGTIKRFISLAQSNPNQYAAIQMYLFRGGFYSSDYNLIPGSYRKQDLDAFKKAIVASAQTRTNFSQYLVETADAVEKFTLPKRQEKDPSLAIQLEDPADIRAKIDATAPNVIGRTLSEQEKNLLVGAYQSLQEKQQRAAFEIQTASGAVGRAPTVPTLDNFIEQKAAEMYPTEAGSMKLASLSEQFLAGIKSGPVNRTF